MTLHEPSWDDARTAAHAAATARPSRALAITEAHGLTLASPLTARAQVPGFDTSMMDGWAVSGPGPWRVAGRVLAGTWPAPLEPAQAIGIATGAAVPMGATAVLRREWGTETDGLLHAERVPDTGTDIRFAGDEARVGDTLLAAGTLVTPPVVGLAALIGVDTVHVHAPASVSVLVLGDEIVRAGVPEPGKVRDALGVQVTRWASRFGVIDHGASYVEDTLAAHVRAIDAARSDIVFTTGGTARGPVDHMHSALAELDATLIVDEVRVRPGHPMLLAQLPDGRFVVGLPGNPLAAIAGYLTLAEPLLHAMAGRSLPSLDTCITSGAITAPGSDVRLIPARRRGSEATPTEFWGSAMLRGIADSDCMLVSEPGGSAAGSQVRVLPLPWC